MWILYLENQKVPQIKKKIVIFLLEGGDGVRNKFLKSYLAQPVLLSDLVSTHEPRGPQVDRFLIKAQAQFSSRRQPIDVSLLSTFSSLYLSPFLSF